VLGAAALQFAVLPRVQTFEMLAVALGIALVPCGLMMTRPKTAGAGVALAMNGAILLALQESYSADFGSFLNTGIALVGGLWLAALVTRIVRSIGSEQGALRLLRAGRATLAESAQQRGRGDRAVFAAVMLDRLSLLVPRLAAAAPDSPVRRVDSLAQLLTGINIVALRRARHALGTADVAAIDAVLDKVARHFRSATEAPPPDLLAGIDAALGAITLRAGEEGRNSALLGLAGLRRGLFPEAPGYEPAGGGAPLLRAA
jgi:uncharacterized membrane protein YccC